MKIKVNIPGFGERYCSDNVEYKLFNDEQNYAFYKKINHIKKIKRENIILHNEYGPAAENISGYIAYFINDKLHRFKNYSSINLIGKYNSYHIIGKYIGDTKEEFIKNLSDTLIPKSKK